MILPKIHGQNLESYTFSVLQREITHLDYENLFVMGVGIKIVCYINMITHTLFIQLCAVASVHNAVVAAQ